MSYIQPKTDFKDGDILYGIDLNASNEVIKAGVDDNFDRIQGLEDSKQDTIDNDNKLDYSLISNTPDIPDKTSDLTNDSGFIDNTYHDSTKQDVLTAGEGIQIENNVISNTQTSAEWGNIQGDIEDQTDLMGIVDDKQDTLISGTNIKTINNQSILGSGNISVGGGSGGTSDYDELDNRPQINSVTLTGNKSLSDLGINIPTKISDLTNDNNTVTDASYVHTDNNYTSAEKTKLAGIEAGAQVNVDEVLVGDVSSATEDTKLVIEDIDLDAQYTESDYYSTEETLTNKVWIDGKPIYRKVINFGALPDTSTKAVAHNISNLDTIIDYKALAKSITATLPIPYMALTVSYGIYMYFDATNITVETGYNRSAYSMYVVLEYTKGGNS